MSPELLRDDKKTLGLGLSVLDAFAAVRPTMPLQHARTLMLVALNEGQGVQEYAQQAGVSQSVMTRHLLDIGMQTRNREPGLDLVTQRADPLDMRKHQTHLTPKGRALIHQVIRILRTR